MYKKIKIDVIIEFIFGKFMQKKIYINFTIS